MTPQQNDAPSTLQQERRSLPAVLRNFCIGSAVLLVLCFGSELLCRYVLGLPQLPYGGPVLGAAARYGDISVFAPRFEHMHSSEFYTTEAGDPWLYPAPAAPIYVLTYHVGRSHYRPFLAFIVVAALSAAWLFFRALRRRNIRFKPAMVFVSVALLCSYPVFFVFNQGNIEIVVWSLCALGVWALVRDRPWLAASLFGLAGAIKLYPLLYLGLLLPRKKWGSISLGALVFIAATVSSLWMLDPNVVESYHRTADGISLFGRTYWAHIRAGEIGFDHSLVGFAKRLLPTMPAEDIFLGWVRRYVVATAAAGGLLYLLRIRHLPFINQVLCLAVACILLPPASYDYTLLHLYLPWALLVLSAADAFTERRVLPVGMAWAFACFVVLLSPQNELIFHGERFGGQVKAIALAALFAISVVVPFPSEFDELSSSGMHGPLRRRAQSERASGSPPVMLDRAGGLVA